MTGSALVRLFLVGTLGTGAQTHKWVERPPLDLSHLLSSSFFETIWSEGIPYRWHVLCPCAAQGDESETWLFPRISMSEHSWYWWLVSGWVERQAGSIPRAQVTRCWSTSGRPPTHCPRECAQLWDRAVRHTWHPMHSPTNVWFAVPRNKTLSPISAGGLEEQQGSWSIIRRP